MLRPVHIRMSRMMRHKMLFYSKAIALTAFAMTAGAGCCYHIMAQDEPYTMPVDTVIYEIETLLAPSESPKRENDTFLPEMVTVPDEPQTPVAPVQPIYDIPLSAELQHDIRELAEHYEISLELVLAVIMTESSGRTDTVGDGGASVGLMQIQPRWYGELIAETGLSVDKPVENVELGIMILLGFIDENDGSLDRALKQYNSGNPDYEGNEYIEQVYEWLNYFEEAGR